MSDASTPSLYTKAYSSFFNALSNHGFIEFYESLALCKIFWPAEKNWNIEKLNTITTIINKEKFCLKKAIKIATCQKTNRTVLLIVNIGDDYKTRLDSLYTPAEQKYFWILLEALIKADKYVLSIASSLDLTSKMRGRLVIQKSGAQQLMQEWLTRGYFLRSGNSLYFGPRSTVEYEEYFLKYYSKYVKLCSLCQTLVLYGRACERCGNLLHNICYMCVLNLHDCPNCNKSTVGE